MHMLFSCTTGQQTGVGALVLEEAVAVGVEGCAVVGSWASLARASCRPSWKDCGDERAPGRGTAWLEGGGCDVASPPRLSTAL